MTNEGRQLRTDRLVGAAFATLLLSWLVSLGTASHSGLAAWDEPLLRFLSTHRSDVIVSLARRLTSLGVVEILIPAALVAGVVLFLKSRSLVLAVVPWVSVQITSVLVATLKRRFDTPRPPLADQVVVVLNPAFPSGHAADTTALVAAVAIVTCAVCVRTPRGRRWVIAAAALLALAMGSTRLILNVHWLSDVVGGTCLGFSVATLCAVVGLSVPRGHQP